MSLPAKQREERSKERLGRQPFMTVQTDGGGDRANPKDCKKLSFNILVPWFLLNFCLRIHPAALLCLSPSLWMIQCKKSPFLHRQEFTAFHSLSLIALGASAARFFILFVRPSSLRACASCLPCTAFIFSCLQEPPSSCHPSMHFLTLPSCEAFLPSSHPSMRFLYLPFLRDFSSIFSSLRAFSSSYFHARHFHCPLMHRAINLFTFSSCYKFCWWYQTSSHPAINSAGAVIQFSSCYQFCWCCHKYSHPAINSADAAKHLLILPLILLVTSYIFSAWHQFCWCCHTYSHPAVNSSCTSTHLVIVPWILLVTAKHLLILQSILLVLPYILWFLSSCHQFC